MKPETLRANNYNPNRVASVEMQLLKLSIIENGWTQPIVARRDGEIVDGFHRWTLGTKDKQVRALAGGLVPVVRLRELSAADQMMATIRHNRARGSHLVLKMADIVSTLATTHKMTEDEIMRRLGMESEEVERLVDARGMPARTGKGKFGKAWTPDEGRY